MQAGSFMGSSSEYGKTYTNGMLRQLNMMGLLESIVDVGAGSGTYKKLMATDLPDDVEWTGIEVWEPNITEFNLNDLYDGVIAQDVRKFNFENLANRDLVLFGDILEHMTKEEAIAVTDNCLEHCKSLMISIPIVHYPQGAEHGNPYEEHIKDDWSHEEVLKTFPDTVAFLTHDHIGVYFVTKDDEYKTFIPMLHNKVAPLCLNAFPNHKIISS